MQLFLTLTHKLDLNLTFDVPVNLLILYYMIFIATWFKIYLSTVECNKLLLLLLRFCWPLQPVAHYISNQRVLKCVRATCRANDNVT